MSYPQYDKILTDILRIFENTKVENPISYSLIKDALKKKPKNIHKRSCGSLAVCAGSTGLTGAAVLACTSALRSGCGLITLCCAKELNPIFEIKLTEVMTKPVSSQKGCISHRAYRDIMAKLQNADALLYGPGLSWNKNIKKLLFRLLKNCSKPIVIDADGLNVLSENTNALKYAKAPIVLTPHIGEFARLTGYDTEYILKNKNKLAWEFAGKYGVVLVLKSHETIVTDGSIVYENILGNPGMAVGGSGDVLSGVIASFLAQGCPPLLSALAGVYIHSLAGDIAAVQKSEYSMIPSDITDNICNVIRELTKT